MNEKRLSTALTTLAISILMSAIIFEMGGTRPANAAATDKDAYSCRSASREASAVLDTDQIPAYMRSASYPD